MSTTDNEERKNRTTREWAEAIAWRNESTDFCPWDKFTSADWAFLLSRKPVYAAKCDWSVMKSEDLAAMCLERSELIDVCDWQMVKQEEEEKFDEIYNKAVKERNAAGKKDESATAANSKATTSSI